jgi:hypothetical protein
MQWNVGEQLHFFSLDKARAKKSLSDKDLSPSNLGLPLSNKNSLLAVWNLHKRLVERDALCESPVTAKEADCVFAHRNLI